jgi:hypothetical protein
MFQLIISVLSIALVALTATATINYVNPTLPIAKQAEQRLHQGFSSLNDAWDRYREHHQSFAWQCDTFTTEIDTYEVCERVVDQPGYLPVASWSDTLVPDYLFLPQPPMGMAWSYGTNPDGWYFCAEGSANLAQLKGFTRAVNAFHIDQLHLSTSCGVSASLPEEELDLDNLKITYWVKRN